MSNVERAKLNEVGVERNVSGLRSDGLLTSFGAKTIFRLPDVGGEARAPERETRKTVRAVTYQLCFDGDAVIREVSVSANSNLWAKLPIRRKSR